MSDSTEFFTSERKTTLSLVVGVLALALATYVYLEGKKQDRIKVKIDHALSTMSEANKSRQELVEWEAGNVEVTQAEKEECLAKTNAALTELQDIALTYHDCAALNELKKYYEHHSGCEDNLKTVMELCRQYCN